MSLQGPPRWAVRLVRALLPSEEREVVLGDLEEEFHARRGRERRHRATVGYVVEGLGAALSLMTFAGQGREGMMTGIFDDLRGGLRVFRRSPGFAALVVLTLAVGVGGATAVYSVIRGVILSPLAFRDSDRVVMLWGQTRDHPRAPLTVGDYNALADGVGSFSGVTAQWSNNALLLGEGEPVQVSLGWVTPEYFDVVGVSAALGRGLEPGDVGGVVISHGLWVRRWGADPGVLGRTVDLPGGAFEIVGVLPSSQNPNLTTFAGGQASHDVWRLQPPEWIQGDDRSVGWLRATARLRDGVSLEEAQAEVDALMVAVNETVTDRDGGTDLRVNVIPVKDDLVGSLSRTLWILFGAVLGVLLIAASNVAHLLLGRGEARSAEVAVRAALGGSRARLVRQLLAESGGLAVAGGLGGLGVAWLGVRGLLALAPPSLPRMEEVRVDGAVFVFALATAAVAALVFGIFPALRASRADVSGALGERRPAGGLRHQRLSRGLVVAEVALSLMLLTATGLLLRSLSGLHRVDLGFETEGIVTFALEAPEWGDSAEAAAARMSDYLDRLSAVPGVLSTAFTNRIPLAGGLFTGTYRSEDMVAAQAEAVEASFRYVTPEYFTTMGARLLTGRTFRPDEGMDVVILDETTAQQAWPGEDPLGRRIQVSAIGEDQAWAEVVGVVAAMKHAGVAEPAAETVFLPMLARAHQQNFRYAAVRVSGAPLAYVEPLREAVRLVDAGAVLARVRTMQDLFAQDTAATRFATTLLAVFGGVALLLATVGLHGVLAYRVVRRTREMGIRLALGARKQPLVREAVASGGLLVAGGVALGTVLSLGLGRVLRALLFEVGSADPLAFSGAVVVMLTVGMVGSYLPARLVVRLDPVSALREE